MSTGEHNGVTRRGVLKGSGLALGGLAFGGAMSGCSHTAPADPTASYTYFENLPSIKAGTPLEDDELRITFVGSGFPPPRRAQAEMCMFVEVGPWVVDEAGYGAATDSFLFDIGAGTYTNLNSLNIQPSRMDKLFIAHLHADHMNDITHLYWFGPSADRKSPLFVFGPAASGVPSPVKWGSAPKGTVYDDGTRAMCENLRAMMRWATESFSFQTTSTPGSKGIDDVEWWCPDKRGAVGDDPANDGYALVPIELDWHKYGKDGKADNVAYRNEKTGVTITHFPVIHTRKGSIGYKLEWNGLSMVYTSDTKPESISVEQAKGADVYIHEMILPAEVLAMKLLDITDPAQVPAQLWKTAVDSVTIVQNSSHTPQGAFGYLLSQVNPKPRLAVATHFTTADDTVEKALESVKAHVPGIKWEKSGVIKDNGEHPPADGGNITWSTDLMTVRVFPDEIRIERVEVSDYKYQAVPLKMYQSSNPAKYDDGDPSTLYGDPYAQIDDSAGIPPGADTYRADGW